MVRILITGYRGYVGSHVATALKNRNAEIAVICRDVADAERARGDGLDGRVVSLEQHDALRDLASRCDGIAHLAASEDPAFLATNRAAIMAMIDGLRAGTPFLMQGGSVVFGDTGAAPVENPAYNPPPPLAARAALDQDVLAMNGNARTCITYGSLVFGGRGAMIPNLLLATAAKVGYSAYVGDGSAIWSAVQIADWADLIARVLLDGKQAGGAVFPAAQSLTMREVAKAVADAFDPPLPVRSVSAADASELWGFFAPALAMNQHFDGTSARDAYGWTPARLNFSREMALSAGLLAFS